MEEVEFLFEDLLVVKDGDLEIVLGRELARHCLHVQRVDGLAAFVDEVAHEAHASIDRLCATDHVLQWRDLQCADREVQALDVLLFLVGRVGVLAVAVVREQRRLGDGAHKRGALEREFRNDDRHGP